MAQTIGRLTPHDGGCSITITAAREVTVFYLFLQLLGNQGQPATLLSVIIVWPMITDNSGWYWIDRDMMYITIYPGVC